MATNGWTKNVERLLRNWSQQISINENEYRKQGSYYRNWYYVFGAFIVIAQTGALTTLINVVISMNTDKDECKKTEAAAVLLVIVAVIETFVLVAQGIDKFFNFGSASEQYYEATKDHNALSRLIDSTLTLPRNDRDVAREVLLSVRQQFNQIQNNSPNLPPNAFIHRLEMCIYDNPEQAKGRQPDGVITIGSDQSIMPEDFGSPPIPENTRAVALPASPPEDSSHDSDEEYVSNAQRCNFDQQLHIQKQQAAREQHQNRRLRNLEYQWRRMEQHAEDDSPGSSTTNTPNVKKSSKTCSVTEASDMV